MIGEYIETSNGIEFESSTKINNLPSFSASTNLTPYQASIVSRNSEVCTIEGNISRSNYETTMNFNDEKITIKSFGQNNTIDSIKVGIESIKTAIKDSFEEMVKSLLPKIYDEQGNGIGNCEVLNDGEGLQNYIYYKYTIKGTVLYAYELSHDTTDILYCIYNEHNQMIATISKQRKIKHGHARYTIYSCNEEWFKYAAILTACWAIEKTERDGGPDIVTGKQSLITLVPELLEKYNPTFIDQVKQKEGIEKLPESMKLVNQKVEESKNAPEVKLYKILWIFIIIVLLIILAIGFLR